MERDEKGREDEGQWLGTIDCLSNQASLFFFTFSFSFSNSRKKRQFELLAPVWPSLQDASHQFHEQGHCYRHAAALRMGCDEQHGLERAAAAARPLDGGEEFQCRRRAGLDLLHHHR
jgi:hypothetical protein